MCLHLHTWLSHFGEYSRNDFLLQQTESCSAILEWRQYGLGIIAVALRSEGCVSLLAVRSSAC